MQTNRFKLLQKNLGKMKAIRQLNYDNMLEKITNKFNQIQMQMVSLRAVAYQGFLKEVEGHATTTNVISEKIYSRGNKKKVFNLNKSRTS